MNPTLSATQSTDNQLLSNPDIFQGFADPFQNWFRVPNEFVGLLPKFETLAEMKVTLYIMRHTWGYQSKARLITIDEFMFGRKRADGSRMDEGTGLSKTAVIDGIKKAIEHNFIEAEVDDSDEARITKTYQIHQKKLSDDCEQSDVAKDYIGGSNFIHRTEKDNKERQESLSRTPKSRAETPVKTVLPETSSGVQTMLDDLFEETPVKPAEKQKRTRKPKVTSVDRGSGWNELVTEVSVRWIGIDRNWLETDDPIHKANRKTYVGQGLKVASEFAKMAPVNLSYTDLIALMPSMETWYAADFSKDSPGKKPPNPFCIGENRAKWFNNFFKSPAFLKAQKSTNNHGTMFSLGVSAFITYDKYCYVKCGNDMWVDRRISGITDKTKLPSCYQLDQYSTQLAIAEREKLMTANPVDVDDWDAAESRVMQLA